MSSQPLTIAHGNIYAANKTPAASLRVLAKHEPESIGLNEANNALREVRRVKGYSVGAIAPVRGKAKATPVLLRAGLEQTLQLATLIAEGLPEDRLAPPRWLTAVAYSHPEIGPFAHVNVHLHAAVMGRSPASSPRANQYGESVLRLGLVLDLLDRSGYAYAVSGDLNMREDRGTSWGPYRLFEELGMRTFSAGLDAIAISTDLRFAGAPLVIPRSRTHGSDHPFIVAGMKRRER